MRAETVGAEGTEDDFLSGGCVWSEGYTTVHVLPRWSD